MPQIPNAFVFALLVTAACGGNTDNSDTDVNASSATASGSSSNAGSEGGTNGGGGNDDGDDGSSADSDGGQNSPEASLCERSDECNVLMPGISVQDCTDLEVMCTDDLITSAKQDWTAEVEECLELANCQNFLGCVSELSVCPPIEPAAACGPECQFCWIGTDQENACPDVYALDGSCDCGCQFVDPEC